MLKEDNLLAGTLRTETGRPVSDPALEARGVADGVLSAIGRTPLVRLRKLFPDSGLRIFAKLEGLNPGGSIKDRPARSILERAIRSRVIGRNTVVVESSSGNMGIGLAQACLYHGLRFICVVDPKTAPQNLRILKLYGAEIDYVAEPDLVTGEFLQARIRRVEELIAKIPNSFWPNQYANPGNSASHYQTTMEEIATALGGEVDHLFIGTSTCGTIRGCGDYVRDKGLATEVIAVDALGSFIFSDQRAKRLTPGLGAGLRPPLCDLTVIHRHVHVTDLDCVLGCRRLLRSEAILAGGSSGGIVSALHKLKGGLAKNATCVLILPDRGERYLDTIFNDEWVGQHVGAAGVGWDKAFAEHRKLQGWVQTPAERDEERERQGGRPALARGNSVGDAGQGGSAWVNGLPETQREPAMKGVEFVVDEDGERSAVLIDLKENMELWEDFYDACMAREREREPRESLEGSDRS